MENDGNYLIYCLTGRVNNIDDSLSLFVEGLAVSLGLRPRRALLNDINPHLINFYRWLNNGLVTDLDFENNESAFYRNRERFNQLVRTGEKDSKEAASLFYYLNRTGYNGLCRFNSRGEFNVPFGRYETITYRYDFGLYKSILQDWEFTNIDFNKVQLKPTDFVYADPPYDVQFRQYSKGGFSWQEQVQLAEWLSLHPGPVILSNQATMRVVEQYELVEPLGSGAVAHVWSAETRSTGTRVAVKIMMPTANLLQESVLPNVRDRFRREARNGKNLSHPNIVSYLDLGLYEKVPFLVMELAERTVAARIKQWLRLSESEAAKIVHYCLDGLEYLHGKGSPHRDIKPANLLEFSDVVKLGDLGIVKWSDYDPAFTKGGTVTRRSMQLGSWNYMSPEQQESPHDAIPASDIYSLAVTWIEMLTGNLPSPQATIASAYKLPAIDPKILELIRRMHSYNPIDRPPISEIRENIRAVYN